MQKMERVRYFYETVVSKHLLDEIPAYVADCCAVRMGETVALSGITGMKQHLSEVRKTYPIFRMSIIRQYCDGDCVISEFEAECVHGGTWLGIKPTGKTLTFTGVNIDRMAGGKIIEHCGYMNTFETLLKAKMIHPAD